MSFRIGVVEISVNFLFLAAAFAYFVFMSRQRLFPAAISHQGLATATLAAVSLCGIAGAWLYGRLGAVNGPDSPGLPPSHLCLGAGSFGGYWGVILGSLAVALVARRSILVQTDAFVPGLLVGGAVARLADLFTGASRGVANHWDVLGSLQPFRYWAAYDIAAHLVTFGIAWGLNRRRDPSPGSYLIVFLVAYGAMRFGLEFVRDTGRWFGPFTHGHVMAAIQVASGMILAVWLAQLACRSFEIRTLESIPVLALQGPEQSSS